MLSYEQHRPKEFINRKRTLVASAISTLALNIGLLATDNEPKITWVEKGKVETTVEGPYIDIDVNYVESIIEYPPEEEPPEVCYLPYCVPESFEGDTPPTTIPMPTLPPPPPYYETLPKAPNYKVELKAECTVFETTETTIDKNPDKNKYVFIPFTMLMPIFNRRRKAKKPKSEPDNDVIPTPIVTSSNLSGDAPIVTTQKGSSYEIGGDSGRDFGFDFHLPEIHFPSIDINWALIAKIGISVLTLAPLAAIAAEYKKGEVAIDTCFLDIDKPEDAYLPDIDLQWECDLSKLFEVPEGNPDLGINPNPTGTLDYTPLKPLPLNPMPCVDDNDIEWISKETVNDRTTGTISEKTTLEVLDYKTAKDRYNAIRNNF